MSPILTWNIPVIGPPLQVGSLAQRENALAMSAARQSLTLYVTPTTKKAARRPPSRETALAVRPLSLVLLFLPLRELLADACRFSGATAKVVELRPAHVALALDLDARDQRRVGLERPLHSLTARHLAHDERRVEPAIPFGDHDAFVCLDALAVALDDVDVDDDRISRGELGNCLAQARHLFVFQLLDDVHALVSPLDQRTLPAARRARLNRSSAPV